jgi:predicted nuclease of predicted toxin-antitoxin system
VKRFKLDENMPAVAAAVLREVGHDVTTVLGQGLGGVQDETVATVCTAEKRILVTLDLDFADMRSYGSSEAPGIIVMRLPRQDAALIRTLMLRALHG